MLKDVTVLFGYALTQALFFSNTVHLLVAVHAYNVEARQTSKTLKMVDVPH